MCGIGGYCGEFEPSLLGRMNRVQSHRGPDGCAEWADEQVRVGLAHRRLAIIDLSPAGAQPMATSDGRFVITYNGETYNYRELRRELEAHGVRFRSKSDTEVLLEGYRVWGAGMLPKLNAMFAFALWDSQRRELLLARDGMGVKPLYYAETPRGFLFASEIKALMLDPSVPRDLDLEAVDQHLALLYSTAPRTILKSVRKVEPGHALIVRDGRIVKKWRFFDLPYDGARDRRAPDALAQDVAAAVQTAVERQMVSDVPVGAFLSGGLDSSAVVAMMRRARPDYRPKCYAIGFAPGVQIEGSPPDLPYARIAARHLDVDLHEIVIEPDAIRNLERMIWHLDEPQADPAPINAMLIAEQAHADGTKVLLSGAGGDDIFTGYRRHTALRAERAWGWLPSPGRRLLATASALAGPYGAPGRRIKRAFEYAALPPDERMVSYFLWSSPARRAALFTREAAAALGGFQATGPLLESLSQTRGEPDRINRMLYLEAKHFLADHNLNYTDKVAMASGVEVRVPLLDPDLVALAARIPPGLKQHGRTGKYIFRKAMAPYLPREVIDRPKTGFGAPLRRWLHSELTEMVSDTLSAESLRRRGLFEPKAVATLIEDDRARRGDFAYLIFALVCLEIWSRQFLDARPAGSA